jgi:hypothetical protein
VVTILKQDFRKVRQAPNLGEAQPHVEILSRLVPFRVTADTQRCRPSHHARRVCDHPKAAGEQLREHPLVIRFVSPDLKHVAFLVNF